MINIFGGCTLHQVFPLTRKLPGAKTPILNPYRDAAEPFKAADDDE